MKDKIEVIVSMPDKKEAERVFAKAIVGLVIDRINKLPPEQRMPTYEELLRRLEE